MYRMFGWEYFLQLFLAVGIIVAMVYFLRKFQDKPRRIAQISLISALGFFLILEYVGRVVMISNFKIGNELPFNIHQIFTFISIIAFFMDGTYLKKFAYLVIVPVSVYGILFVPEIYCQGGGFSLAIISYILLNSVLVSNALLNMFWSEDGLRKKDISDAIVTFVFILAIVHVINVILRVSGIGTHANYFGTMGDSYDMVIGWLHSLFTNWLMPIVPVGESSVAVPFLCLLPLIAILVGVMFVMVIPFEMMEYRKKRQENIEELIALGNMKKQQEMREQSKKPKSQVLVRSETKAKPEVQKKVVNKSDSGFVATTKEIQVNKDNSEN